MVLAVRLIANVRPCLQWSTQQLLAKQPPIPLRLFMVPIRAQWQPALMLLSTR